MAEHPLDLAAWHLAQQNPQNDQEVLSICDEILSHDFNSARASFLGGTAALRMKLKGIARLMLMHSSQLNADNAASWNNLGCTMHEWRPEEAEKFFRQALDVDPEHYEAKKNLAPVLGRVGKRDEAIKLFHQLRTEMPDDLDVPFNMALDLLHTEDWASAFDVYRYSEGNPQRKQRNYHGDQQTPRWDGKAKEKVVIFGEQGVGDEIVAYSCLDRAYETGAELIIDCDKRLETLLKRSFPELTIYGTRHENRIAWPTAEQPDSALFAMAAFGKFMTPQDKPKPWLKPDPDRVEMYRAMLERRGGPGPKIGLSWSGGARDWDRAERSIPIEQLGPIMAIPNATIVNLEYVDGPSPEGIINMPNETAKGVDLDATAALVAALDVVVSVPQTVLDIAGAVGTPIRALVGIIRLGASQRRQAMRGFGAM
jgi:tetratricopeptide (TPR) repeat protein